MDELKIRTYSFYLQSKSRNTARLPMLGLKLKPLLEAHSVAQLESQGNLPHQCHKHTDLMLCASCPKTKLLVCSAAARAATRFCYT